MSADNGVYIAKFPDGYRVSYASAIDNIDFFPEGSVKRKKELKKYFGKSKIFDTEDNAKKEARLMEKEFTKDGDYLEYGVCFIGEYESFNCK